MSRAYKGIDSSEQRVWVTPIDIHNNVIWKKGALKTVPAPKAKGLLVELAHGEGDSIESIRMIQRSVNAFI